MTRGDVTVHRGATRRFLEIALDKLVSAGGLVETRGDAFRVRMDDRPQAVDVVTLPYPGFATDLLPMAIGLAAVSDGASLITENIFDGRFMFVNEMMRLGADIKTDGHHAVVRGRDRLSGAPGARHRHPGRRRAGHRRALRATGSPRSRHVHHVDRGYPDFVADLRGARRRGGAGHRTGGTGPEHLTRASGPRPPRPTPGRALARRGPHLRPARAGGLASFRPAD